MNLAAIVNPDAPVPGVPTAKWGYSPAKRAGYLHMSHREYMEFPGINASLLKCPTLSEMWSMLTAPMKDTQALAVGTLTDLAITGGMDTVMEQFAVVEVPVNPKTGEEYGRDTKRAAAAYEEAKTANPGKFLISAAEYEDAKAELVRNYTAHKEYKLGWKYLKDEMIFQATGIMWREDLGAWVKWRPDALPLRPRETGWAILDVKTSRRHLDDFKRDLREFGYAYQAVWYKRCHEMCLERLGFCLNVASTDYLVISKADEDGRRPRRAMCRLQTLLPMRPEANLLVKPAWTHLFPEDGMGRAEMFLGGLREHLATNPDPEDGAAIRRIWHAYENDERPWVLCEEPKSFL